MSTYISSNANRFYVGLEAAYGQAATVTSGSRFPALRLHAHQSLQAGTRHDKTGARTFVGRSASSRRATAFEVQTYLTSWTAASEPSYGPLFTAALGAPASLSSGLVIGSVQGLLQMQATAPHGLFVGSGVSFEGELRFVTSVEDSVTFSLNAPFRNLPQPGSALASTVTYSLSNALPSVTIYDYWDPISAVSRIVVGGAIDLLSLTVNGDFHEFSFSGPAADLLDSSSFVAEAAGLGSYPSEPALAAFDYAIVPGHLGEVWLGGSASQFFTLTGATIEVRNNVETRAREYGSSSPRAIAAGQREVVSHFAVLAQDDAQTVALYAASKQRTPIGAMLQLGQQQGQLMGLFMPQVVPEIPLYNDSKPRLEWEFNNNLAQGFSNDEIFIAFA